MNEIYMVAQHTAVGKSYLYINLYHAVVGHATAWLNNSNILLCKANKNDEEFTFLDINNPEIGNHNCVLLNT